MSDRRLPTTVWSRERSVNWIESVLDEGVRHGGRLAIGRDNIDSLQGDNLRRGYGITRPVPVWRSQVLGRGNPALFINLVRVGDLNSMLTQHLLDNLSK